MHLISVYEQPSYYVPLYYLLAERDQEVNISHKRMPDWHEHIRFVDSKPYEAWYFIYVDEIDEIVGAVYLTRAGEIGVHVFKDWQGQRHGRNAVKALMEKHGPRRFLANIAPGNERSQRMFKDLGFNLIQHTYECV